MSKVRISYQPPTHGWLTLQLVIDAHIVEIDASDTPNNPVQDLISALYSAAGATAASVWFHLEPGGYYMHFEPNGDNIRLRLDYAPESKRNLSRGILEIEGSREDILLPFWRFIRDFQSRCHAEPHWPGVDYRDVDAIRERISCPSIRPQDRKQ